MKFKIVCADKTADQVEVRLIPTVHKGIQLEGKKGNGAWRPLIIFFPKETSHSFNLFPDRLKDFGLSYHASAISGL